MGKKEKKFTRQNPLKKKSKFGKDKWSPLYDVEKRQMMQMMDGMPSNVQMYDPSMQSMDEMMESMKAMYGDDMPEFDDEGNVIEKAKKKKKKRKKKEKQNKNGEGSLMDTISNGIDY